jgi:SNF2 family DNA or RNA helicase
MLECVTGIKSPNIQGCILADEMGLGKTLQIITLVYILSKQNPYCFEKPFFKKILILCPLSLVSNWKNEIKKFLGGMKLSPTVITSNRI